MRHLDDALEFADNPDPRCPVVLALDTSGSMAGAPSAALNDGLHAFVAAIRQDPLAARRVEFGLVSFGGGVLVVRELATLNDNPLPHLQAGGNTPMGAGIERAL